jgi:Transmembrane secretion effector
MDRQSGRDSAFHDSNFRLFLSARFLGNIATQIQSVAIGWQVYALTGNVLDLGFIGLAQFAPFVALVLFAGQVADRYDRKRIITICHAVSLLCGVLLLAFTLLGTTRVWPVFGVLAIFGAARAFLMPAGQAIVINLVPAASFNRAVALNSSTFHLAVVLGPVLGGVLYLAGPHVAYVVSSSLLALSVLLLLRMRVARRDVAAEESASWHALFDGLRYVWSRPLVLGAISLDLFAVLFGGATALLPAYARDLLDIGPTGLGLLRTAPAAGAAITAAVLTMRPITANVGRWMFGGVALFGLATIVFGCSRSPALSFVALAITGAGDMVSVYIRHILVQLATPDSIRGRVSAVNAVFIGASNELGEFESGLTAKWFGLVRSVVIGGIATLVVTGAWMALFPGLRKMTEFPQAAPANASTS